MAFGFAIVTACLVFPCATAYGADPPDDNFHLRTGAGMWLMSMNGKTGVRNTTVDVDADFSDIWDNLNFAFNPQFELTKGNWVLGGNFFYAQLEDSKTIHSSDPNIDGRGGDVTADMGIFDMGIGYTVVRTEFGDLPFTLTPGIGGRVTYVDLSVNPNFSYTRGQSRTWFDPYIGVRATLGLTKSLNWRTQGTIGGFDVGSQFTWSAGTYLDWQFSDRFSLTVGYQALNWDYDLDNFKWDMTFHGPYIGLNVKWF
jgi:hypothetical protein